MIFQGINKKYDVYKLIAHVSSNQMFFTTAYFID